MNTLLNLGKNCIILILHLVDKEAHSMTERRTSLPLYLQIAAKIKKQIETEDYMVGDRLPFERWFIDHYNVSRVTIRKALEELISEGIVERRPYQGLYVCQKEMQMHSDSPIYSFGLSDDGPEITSKILSFDILNVTDKLQTIFQYQKETRVYYINILRYYNGAPFTIQSVYLNKELLPDLDIFLLKDLPLYEIIEKNYQLSISHLNVSMSISIPAQEQAEWLQVSPMDSLLQATDTLYLADSRVVRYAVSLYTNAIDYNYTVYK